jgi:branched-chain amino acid aminotransferase
MTPQGRYVLEGVSRQTAMELSRGLGIPVEERDLDLYDAYNADEVFLTSTSLCICPVAEVNGAKIAGGTIPGAITKKLLDAYSELVGCDIVGQYLARLD